MRLLLAMLIVISFTLITLDYRSGEGGAFGAVRRGTMRVFGPVQRAVTAVVSPIGNALSTLGELGSIRGERDDLRKKLQEAEGRLRETEELRRRLAEIEGMLDLSARGKYTVVPANIFGVSIDNFEKHVTIDVGSKDGIKVGQTVVNGLGLVGRVFEVTPNESRVLLAIDAEFRVNARIAHSGCIGFLRGNGDEPMVLELISPEADVEPGDIIVTGAAGTFTPGVPIGVATEVSRPRRSLTKTITVDPFVSFGSLDVVGVVVRNPDEDPRDAVLPTRSAEPSPDASVSASPGASASPGSTSSPSASASPSPSPSQSAAQPPSASC